MNLLFVYGTLRDPNVQQQVFGRTSEVTPDVLSNFAIEQIEIDGTQYPIASQRPGAGIGGGVISVSDAELEKIDKYETDAYVRKKVTLRSGTAADVYCRISAATGLRR